MVRPKKKTQIHFEHLLSKLHEETQQVAVYEKFDFYYLLKEISDYYRLTPEELLIRGFRKAYRQAVEGV